MSQLPQVEPGEIGLDAERLQIAYNLLEKWTNGPEAPVPGGAILVGRHGKIAPPRFFGRQGPEADAHPIRDDGMFLLASISKPLTYLAAMLLVERGALLLSDPVTRYIPDFAAHNKEETLVHHLFTHTSGMPDTLPNNVELRSRKAPLSTFIQGAIRDTVPLFKPGTNYKYQSMGTLVVAELIQQLSGQTIHEFLKDELFRPLGLNSIGLGSKGFERERLIRVQTPKYQQGGDFGWNSKYWQELGSPWGGVFSSPQDLAVICQLMLNGGRLGKTRLLSPHTIERMTTNRLHEYPELPEPIRRTQPWGLGWQLNHAGTASSWSDLLSPQAYGHTGATGTMCWLDPKREGFCLLLTTAIRSRAPWRLVQLSNIVAASFV